jgi:hypothetical protein
MTCVSQSRAQVRCPLTSLPLLRAQQIQRATVSSHSLSAVCAQLTFTSRSIAAVLAGAVIGHYLFSRDLQHQVGDGVDKGVGCH